MISVFLREQKRYSQEELVKAFECSEEKTAQILKRLKEYGVLKAVKTSETQKNLSDLVEADIEIADVEIGENEEACYAKQKSGSLYPFRAIKCRRARYSYGGKRYYQNPFEKCVRAEPKRKSKL